MREQRLLERLRSLEREPLRRGEDDRERLCDSILAHLGSLLNTRQGGVPIAPGYGIPDLLDFLQGYPESVREIELGIRQAIELYEPRLQGVKVAFLPRDQQGVTLHFRIEARLRDGGAVSFLSVVGADGSISLGR